MECVPKTVSCPICTEPMECTSPGRLYQCTNEECGWELAWGPANRDDEIILKLEIKLERMKRELLVRLEREIKRSEELKESMEVLNMIRNAGFYTGRAQFARDLLEEIAKGRYDGEWK